MQRGLAFIILPLKKIEPLAIIRIATNQKEERRKESAWQLAIKHKANFKNKFTKAVFSQRTYGTK